jgi:hypothetical protein
LIYFVRLTAAVAFIEEACVNETPMFCHPYQSSAELAAWLQGVLDGARDFDPRLNVLPPVETRRSAANAVRERRCILLEVYNSYYYTDCFEDERLAGKVESGEELIWFWGSEAVLQRLRGRLQGSGAGEPPARAGTVSVTSARRVFGLGCGELCHAGSLDHVVRHKYPAVLRTLDFLAGNFLAGGEEGRYHTLLLTTRNRAAVSGVRGGEAVHRVHAHYLRSRFWGFAPWYLMHGDVTEPLDLREQNQRVEDVLQGVARFGTWWLTSPEEARYAEALWKINFGGAPAIRTAPSAVKGSAETAFVTTMAPEPIRAYNPAFISMDRSGAGIDLAAAVKATDAAAPACVVAVIPLNEEGHATHQAWLRDQGFRLAAILPPKLTGLPIEGRWREIAVPPRGLWWRGRKGLRIVPPYYARWSRSTLESEILEYLERL